MNKVLCSTGTIIGRSNDYNYKLIGEYADKINCDGFELLVEDFKNTADIMDKMVSDLLPMKINFETIHAPKSIGEFISRNEAGDIDEGFRIFEMNCKAASELGAGLLVLHLWSGPPSDKNIGVNIKAYGKLLEIAGNYNIIPTVESVVCNTYNPLIHMKKLYETYGNEMKFTVDVRHLEFHNILKEIYESDCDYLWENNLVPHFHIADWRGGCMDWSKLRPVLPPGNGDIDFTYLSDFLKKTGYKGSFTLEAAGAMSPSGIDFGKLNKSLGFIYKNLV